jgi:hypothetical protein
VAKVWKPIRYWIEALVEAGGNFFMEFDSKYSKYTTARYLWVWPKYIENLLFVSIFTEKLLKGSKYYAQPVHLLPRRLVHGKSKVDHLSLYLLERVQGHGW